MIDLSQQCKDLQHELDILAHSYDFTERKDLIRVAHRVTAAAAELLAAQVLQIELSQQLDYATLELESTELESAPVPEKSA